MNNEREIKKPITDVPTAPVDYAFEKLIKGFMKQIEKDGILQEVKDRKYYNKPSDIKRASRKELERKYGINIKFKHK